MSKYKRRFGALITVCVAVASIGALAASSASAAWVEAEFKGGPGVKISASGVTAKRNGAEAKACVLQNEKPAPGTASGSLLEYGNTSTYWSLLTRFSCGGSAVLEHYTQVVEAQYETVSKQYRLEFYPEQFLPIGTPWSTSYWPGYYSVPFTNGSGSTPSKFTFADTVIGQEGASGKKISLSGTFTITSSTGGLVTLVP